MTPARDRDRSQSLLLVGIGVALLVESAIVGGGSLGWALGALFVLAGAGRLYLSHGA